MEKKSQKLICDANEAVAIVSHKTNEVCAIYPITPASPMGEHVDVYSSKGQKTFGVMYQELLKCKVKEAPLEQFTVRYKQVH